MDDLETLEARYDAMPPEIARKLRLCNGDPLSNRHHALKAEIAFARRMFQANQRARRSKRHVNPATRRQYGDDCRHWWHRYRRAQASAAQVNNLLAVKTLSKSILRNRI